uniref:Membrane metallo-endopeptidase-like 1 n=1 Tax=Anabas testudineus TaxID=64144 RepID=A0A7N6F9U8_ANATE
MGKSESQMDIMEKSTKPGKRRWTVAEIGLSVLLLLVSCALAGLVVLYTSIAKEQSNMQSVSRSSTGEGQLSRSNLNNVCTTADCVTAAARLLQNMDKSVKPCDNFYQHACGGWLERHVIPETSSRHSVFDILRDKLEIVLKGVLEMENEQDRDAIRKAKVLYSSCMNDSEVLLTLLYSSRLTVAAMSTLIFQFNQYYGSSRHDWLRHLRLKKEVLQQCYCQHNNLPGTICVCRTMQNYLTWQLIIDRVNSLSRRFKDARARYRKTLYGTTVEDAWWRECVRYVQSSMENAVGALYVRETFAGESKRMVSLIVFKRIGELSWMDSPSKEKAREKAMAIKEHIGYPDHILQESNQKLDQEYAHVSKSVITVDSVSQSPLRWIIGAAVVNAFYSPNRNQIVFPAGILQPPFFSKHQHQALNFGGIGMVIGHEITHGFDDNGRNFDKDGNMLNWWSNYSAEHFKEQSQCMVQQYGNFNWKLAGGQNVSGISTLGENIADNGGVRQAYKAYLKWVEMEGEEPRLPGLDMDHKQLFFLNFAQVWCGAYRPEYASQSIKTDSHSPLEYRVLGSLQNFEAFSEAFQCQKGSPMNPELKCRVW